MTPCGCSTCDQGFLQTALVVSSFHVLEEAASDGTVQRVVRILYGEGDRYGCWLDVAADAIVWHEVKGGEGQPAQQQIRAAPLQMAMIR